LLKQAVVDQTSGGVKYLMDKNNITVLEGLGSFVDATHVALQKQMELQKPLKQNIIIARFETIFFAIYQNRQRKNHHFY
jgi:dihydrolipoamide dehydrogenase